MALTPLKTRNIAGLPKNDEPPSIYGTPEELAQRPPISKQIADVGGKVANALRSIPGIGYKDEEAATPAPATGQTSLIPSHSPGSAGPISEYRGADPAKTSELQDKWLQDEKDIAGTNGSGRALVGGKSIKYQNIGIAGKDPLAGQGGLIQQGTSPSISIAGPLDPATATSLRNRVDWSPGSANVKNIADTAKYDDEVVKAIRINAANGIMPTPEQTKRTGMSIADQTNLLQANNIDGRFDKPIAGLQEQNKADTTLQANKIAANAGIAEHKIAADAQVKTAELAAGGRVAATKAAHAQDADKETQKALKERAEQHYKAWEALNIPPEYRSKLQEYANTLADAEDPKGSTFILGAQRPGLMGAALPRGYKPVYDQLRKSMPHADAAARVYATAKKQGHVIDMPDFYQYPTLTDARKNIIAGV